MLTATLVTAAGAAGTVPVLAGRVDVRRLRRTPAVAAALVLVVTLIGPFDAAGEQRSIAVHVLQHLVLISLAPALLVAALRDALPARPLGNGLATVLLLGSVAAIWIAHLPPVMDATVRTPALNDATHLALLVAGVALVWPLAAARPLTGFAALAYLGVAELLIGGLGLLLAWYPEQLYAAYAPLEPLWGLDRASDQSLAGALLLVVEEPFLMIEVAVLFFALLDQDEEDP